MNQEKKTPPIPPEAVEKASELIDMAFDAFKDHLGKLNAAETEFNANKEEVEKRIKRGARRANRPIV